MITFIPVLVPFLPKTQTLRVWNTSRILGKWPWKHVEAEVGRKGGAYRQCVMMGLYHHGQLGHGPSENLPREHIRMASLRTNFYMNSQPCWLKLAPGGVEFALHSSKTWPLAPKRPPGETHVRGMHRVCSSKLQVTCNSAGGIGRASPALRCGHTYLPFTGSSSSYETCWQSKAGQQQHWGCPMHTC